jgi:hypothetical protein
METTVSSLLQAEAHKHRKLASDLLALLEAAKAEHPDAMLVMCLASITMMVFYAILTPYHRLVSAPTMTIGQLQEGMQKVCDAYARVLKREKGSFQRLMKEVSEDDFETTEAVKKLRPWTRKLPAAQSAKLDRITWAALKRSLEKMEKEQKKVEKVSPLMAPDTIICGTSRKAESVFGCAKEMEVDHKHLSLRRIFVQARAKVNFSSLF